MEKRLYRFVIPVRFIKMAKLVGAYTLQRDLTQVKELVEQNIVLQDALNSRISHNLDVVGEGDFFKNVVGKSGIFLQCKSLVARAAVSDSPVMLIGDTGSGKEVFARAVHELSPRRRGPFLALNCAAIPESLIESILFGTTKGVYTGAIEKEGLISKANGGTIFLDELNSMPLASQAKLLRVLEDKKIMKLGSSHEQSVDVRIVSSMNKQPLYEIERKHLREDLYYRLSVVQINIPPLKERKEDIPLLVDYFIKEYNKRFQKNVCDVSNDVLEYFFEYSWPGNVRQLKACIESAMIFAKGIQITYEDLPRYIFNSSDSLQNVCHAGSYEKNVAKRKTEDYEREVCSAPSRDENDRMQILHALAVSKGNKAKAARNLGISRQLLQYRIKKYHIED